MWKPDVERCARYRVTNPKGSACGRCMKTCPYNAEGLLVHRAFLWAAIKWKWTRPWIARLDDQVGNGKRNPVKKWWFDLELIDGVAVTPRGANARDLNLQHRLDPAEQKIALYPAETAPPPGQAEPFPVDRAEALRRGAAAERPPPRRGPP
jgi:ferredoxin